MPMRRASSAVPRRGSSSSNARIRRLTSSRVEFSFGMDDDEFAVETEVDIAYSLHVLMVDISNAYEHRDVSRSIPPHAYFVGSAVFHYLGPAFAVLLFASVHPLGVAWLRIATAAAIFALWRRPWRVFAQVATSTRRTSTP